MSYIRASDELALRGLWVGFSTYSTENRYLKPNFGRVLLLWAIRRHHITFAGFVIMLVGKFLSPLRSDDRHRSTNYL